MNKNGNINKGAVLFSLIFVLLFFVVAVRFIYIETTKQVDGKGPLTKIARANWREQEDLSAQRGTIFDANGQALAKDVDAYTVVAILSKKAKPDYVKNPEKVAEKLAPILNIKEGWLQDRLSMDGRFQVELGSKARRISTQKKKKIEKLDLDGIHFRLESKRYYPNQTFASYVLGFANRSGENNTLQGIMGIEKAMNKKLTGEDGAISYQSSENGVKLPEPDEKKQEPHDGDNVYLTINSRIQTFLNQAMANASKKYEPKEMMAAVIEPKTGKVLAMANRPTFNPNEPDINHYLNGVVSDAFEPGSSMKIFTLSAAVDAGVYNGQEQYQSGTYKISGGTIHDWNNGDGFGKITYNKGLRRSSNVAFAKLANEKIGFDRFHDYLKKFDFDQKTGIGLPNEGSSKIQYDVPIEKATTAFGQGTAVTALQQLKAATAVANDGKMMKPYIIDKVVNPNKKKTVLKKEPKVAGEPISAESAEKVRDLLRTVVSKKDGTGKDFAIEGYKVAGKTGTAQIPKQDGSGYMTDDYIHSFIGMAPKKDPQLLMYVAVNQPKVKNWHEGGDPVADIFRSVMKKSLQYKDIDAEQNEKNQQAKTILDYKGRSLQKAQKSLQDQGFNVQTIGSGDTVLSQQPVPETSLYPGSMVMLYSGGKVKMPDLTGWSLADVMKLAQLLHIQPDIKGTGFVKSQSIPAGNPVEKGETMTIQLSSQKSSDDKKSS